MTANLFDHNIFTRLSDFDFFVLYLAIVPLFLISYFFGREEKDTGDFFLGGRKVPSIVACLSFVATEVSALTIVGVPAIAYSENWEYMQFFFGSAAARIAVAFLFIPVFYKYKCTSIYEYLKFRFGAETQYTGSIFFFLTRLTASGVRLYATCMAVAYIIGWNLSQAIIFFTIVSIIFIAFGGIKAVVWAGAYQAVIFFAAGAALVIYLVMHIQGGLSTAWQIAENADRLSVFNFNFKLNDATTFWAGTANAFFVGLAIFGTDQELMQRLLTVKTRKKSQNTIIATILCAFPVLCLYLAIGTLLFVFYHQNPAAAQPEKAKEVLSHFIANSLPMGLKGLLLGAIILASIDSPLSSLSCSFVTDIYKPLIKRDADERHYLLVSRIGVVGFGIILGLIAFACSPVEKILWFAFEIISITGGATLGIFLLGVLTKPASGKNASVIAAFQNRANVAAMIISAIAVTVLLLLSKYKTIDLAWSWLIVIGTAVTFYLAVVLEFFMSGIMKLRGYFAKLLF
ncbi:MAG: sodium/solute symporter [Sedimentisphaerales bacterium]|nr:sodium/solute symporter [Sedimentisphaerales bacterium]